MKYYDYSVLNNFLYDPDLMDVLCANTRSKDLLQALLQDDFLKIDVSMRIPHFAASRDYIGAREAGNPDARWIVKLIRPNKLNEGQFSMIVYFLDFLTHTISAPSIVTKINGKVYRASKLVMKAEQLSGANYTKDPILIEQLALDLVNRWIYFDEDRNPNNYMIKKNSLGNPVMVAIDFGNSDLVAEKIKIQGVPNQFGWERTEATRYLTPLNYENFKFFDMSFFNIRFKFFEEFSGEYLYQICSKILRFDPNADQIAKVISNNLMNRIDYVQNYFESVYPLEREHIVP